MNSVALIGRLTRDPELRRTQNGKSVCSFTLAVQRDREKADFIQCQAWEKTAENLCAYMHKGSQIGVLGSIQTSTSEENGVKKFYTQVFVKNLEFLEPRSESNQTNPYSQQQNQNQYVNPYSQPQQAQPYTQQGNANSGSYAVPYTEDLPF